MKILFVLAAVVLAGVSGSFPDGKYRLQLLWGCPGENGANSAYSYKCNQFLKYDDDDYVILNRQQGADTAFYLSRSSNGLYKIRTATNKYLSYDTKYANWAVVDSSDSYMEWEILPRGQGYMIRSKYNCPSWPCNSELTTGDSDETYVWLESGHHQNFRIIPA